MKYFIRIILISIIASTLFSADENSKDKLQEYDLKKAEQVRQAELKSIQKDKLFRQDELLQKEKLNNLEQQDEFIDLESLKLEMKEKEFRNNHSDGNTRDCNDSWYADGYCDGDNNTCADCAGVPNGSAHTDDCGVCVGGTTGNLACVQDCMGLWGGSATEETFWLDIDGDGLGSGDGYDLCNGLDLSGWVTNGDDFDDNCASNFHDECGVCDGDGSSCADCAGVPNGDSWVSDCGCVASGNDGNDCDDCFGTPNGTAWASDCGCVPAGNSGDDCDDCANVPNGDNVVDNCDTCDNDSSNDSVQDCAGTWGGS